MSRILVVCCFIFMFTLIGCNNLNENNSEINNSKMDDSATDVSEVDPKDLPQVRAFQDEFTRGFLQSTKKVEDGYYTFQSKTGGYTMNYPEDTKLNPVFYTENDKYFEFIQFDGSEEPASKLDYFVRATYMDEVKPASLSTLLNMLSDDVNYEGDYEQLSLDDHTIYYGTKYFSHESMDGKFYNVFGLVKSNSMNKSVSLIYSVKCEIKERACKDEEELIENEALKLMKSIEFTND